MQQPISAKLIQGESYKFYLAPTLWVLYLVLYPYFFQNLNLFWSLLLIIFPGVFLFTWISVLMHESFHKYVPNVPNNFFYSLYSSLLLTDPQIYRITHPTHHRHIHTWDDLEFHPLGYIENKYLRRVYNLCEVVFGHMFLYQITAISLTKHPKFSWKAGLVSSIPIYLIIGTLFLLSHYILGVTIANILISWALVYFIGGLFIHTNQLFQHGGIIAENDTLEERNLLTRNIKSNGLINKLFLFLTHKDAQEHTLHHSQTKIYTRPFPNTIPMPSNSRYTSFKNYFSIAWQMIKN